MKKYPHLHPLMISLDTAMLDGSYGNALERQEEYAAHLGGLTIIVLNTAINHRNRLKPYKKNTLHIIPTNSVSRWHTIIDGYRIGAHVIRAKPMPTINLISTQDAFISGLIGVLLKKKFDAPLNIQLHAADLISPHWQKYSLQNKLLTHLAKWVLPQADTLRYGSDQSLAELKKIIPSLTPRVFKAPVYVDAHYYRKAVSPKRSIKNVVTVGRLAWEKNQLQLIEAFGRLSEQNPSVHLIIVGGGTEEKNLKQKITELGLEGRITITGFVSKTQVRDCLHQADLFVLPSFSEGWGMAVVEAVAAGVPVVMTNVGCAGELIQNDKTGVIFDDSSAQGICDALTQALKHPEKMYAMAEEAQSLLNTTHAKNRLIDDWLRCLNETSKIKN